MTCIHGSGSTEKDRQYVLHVLHMPNSCKTTKFYPRHEGRVKRMKIFCFVIFLISFIYVAIIKTRNAKKMMYNVVYFR